MVKEGTNTRFRNLVLAGWLIAFGLPFVLISDLFPLHRFGMFARMPNPTEEVQIYSIEVKTKPKHWLKLEIGNPYFDKSYFYHLASDAFDNQKKTASLADKLLNTLSAKPDSIRLVKQTMNTTVKSFIIYPNP